MAGAPCSAPGVRSRSRQGRGETGADGRQLPADAVQRLDPAVPEFLLPQTLYELSAEAPCGSAGWEPARAGPPVLARGIFNPEQQPALCQRHRAQWPGSRTCCGDPAPSPWGALGKPLQNGGRTGITPAPCTERCLTRAGALCRRPPHRERVSSQTGTRRQGAASALTRASARGRPSRVVLGAPGWGPSPGCPRPSSPPARMGEGACPLQLSATRGWGPSRASGPGG